MRACVIIVVLIAASTLSAAQASIYTADTVARLTPGTGQQVGQGPAFFPGNVVGEPALSARDTVPATDPRDICSIGLGGEIVLGLRDRVIIDGPGPDFTVFENVFRYNGTKIYAEPARVAVSRDGGQWAEFPWDSLSLIGCAGRTPTTGDDPYDPAVSGGDSFDLSSIGVDSIRWIRITDVTAVILDHVDHPYYDPSLTGFDLDAVTTRYSMRVADRTQLRVIPRSTDVDVSVASQPAQLVVADVQGRELYREQLMPGVYTRSFDTLIQSCLIVLLYQNDIVAFAKVLQ